MDNLSQNYETEKHFPASSEYYPPYLIESEDVDERWKEIQRKFFNKSDKLTDEEIKMLVPYFADGTTETAAEIEKGLVQYFDKIIADAKSAKVSPSPVRDSFELMYAMTVAEKGLRDRTNAKVAINIQLNAPTLGSTSTSWKSLRLCLLLYVNEGKEKKELTKDYKECDKLIDQGRGGKTLLLIAKKILKLLKIRDEIAAYQSLPDEILQVQMARIQRENPQDKDAYFKAMDWSAKLYQQKDRFPNGLPKSLTLDSVKIPQDPVSNAIFLPDAPNKGTIQTSKLKVKRDKTGKAVEGQNRDYGEIEYRIKFKPIELQSMEIVDFNQIEGITAKTKAQIDHLTPFHRLVLTVVSNLCIEKAKKGEKLYCTFREIYRNMGKDGNPSKDDIEKIENALEELRSGILEVNNQKEVNIGLYPNQDYFKGEFVSFVEYPLYYQDGRMAPGIEFWTIPPLFAFASRRGKNEKGQMLTVDRKALGSLQMTDMNLAVEQYLQMMISTSRSQGCKLVTPKYQTMIDKCAKGNPNTKRAVESFKKYAKHYEISGEIKDLKIEEDYLEFRAVPKKDNEEQAPKKNAEEQTKQSEEEGKE